jgi:hypothetical protein
MWEWEFGDGRVLESDNVVARLYVCDALAD